MKYTIQGFNQLEAIKLGLNNDDLSVLRWFIDFKNTSKMEKNYIKEVNDMGYWVSYSTLIEELPILSKDGPKYLEEYIELQKSKNEIKEKEFKELYKKLMEKNLKRVQRLLTGNISKVLKRDICKFGPDKGAKVYLYVDTIVYEKLISDTNIKSYLKECGVDIMDNKEKSLDKSVQSSLDKNVQSSPDKNVQSSPDKNVQSDSSTTNPSTTNPSTTTKEKSDNVVVTEIDRAMAIVEIKKAFNQLVDADIKKVADSLQSTTGSYNMEYLKEKIEITQNTPSVKNITGFLIKAIKENFISKSLCNEDKNIPKVKTRFHNINESFSKHTPEELERILLESQKGKFGENANKLKLG